MLSHVLPNGEERPVEYISRMLSPAEARYAQIDREALAIVWAVKRFHLYLYGREFTLVTDHKALTFIFGKHKNIPEMSASHITRWAIFLMNYQFDVKYRNTKDHGNADMLSRLSKPVKHSKDKDEWTETFSLSMSESLLDTKLVAKETSRDAVLSKVKGYILDGWPEQIDKEGEMAAFWSRKSELTVELDCILWGNRVVIPLKLRGWVLQVLHSTHGGMVGMKSLARSYVWFPKLDKMIEDTVRTCEVCAKFGKSLPKLEDHPWTRPNGPFQRVHVDFCELNNTMWFVLQCAYSKWPEVIRMNKNTTSSATIKVLTSIFARTGIPMTLVSDNGPQLVSEEMEAFLKRIGVNHVTVPTYSPKSNGICERFVGTFKASVKKMGETCSDIDKNVANFLLMYRNTPHPTTKQSPAVLAFNRSLRCNLHAIKPSDRQKREDFMSYKEQKILDTMKNSRSFVPDELVFVQVDNEKGWKPAKIVKRYQPTSNVYDIEFQGRIIKKHADKIKARSLPDSELTQDSLTNLNQSCISKNLPVSDPHVKIQGRETLDSGKVPGKELTVSKEPSVIDPSRAGTSLTGLSPRVAVPTAVGGDTMSQRPNRRAKSLAIANMKGMK